MPPPTSKMTWRSVDPMGTSARPPLTTLPASEKALVPLHVSLPMAAYAAAPWAMIHATLAKVSTLLMLVGLPQRPETAGNGGRFRGMPRSPMMEAMSAVSSPQTKAPAPSLILSLKAQPLPNTSSPRKPRSSATAIASRSRRTASGYSART